MCKIDHIEYNSDNSMNECYVVHSHSVNINQPLQTIFAINSSKSDAEIVSNYVTEKI